MNRSVMLNRLKLIASSLLINAHSWVKSYVQAFLSAAMTIWCCVWGTYMRRAVGATVTILAFLSVSLSIWVLPAEAVPFAESLFGAAVFVNAGGHTDEDGFSNAKFRAGASVSGTSPFGGGQCGAAAFAGLPSGTLGVLGIEASDLGCGGNALAQVKDSLTFLPATTAVPVSLNVVVSGDCGGRLTCGFISVIDSFGRGVSAGLGEGGAGLILSGAVAAGESFGFIVSMTCTSGERQNEVGGLVPANCDFSKTALISLSLPPGVTFTSASGVFLTEQPGGPPPPPPTAVLEPSTLLLFGSGLAGLGLWRRMRKDRV